MKQTLRFLFAPWTFFNQLQWSRHHWLLLAGFLALALVESQVGKQQALYHSYAQIVQNWAGISYTASLWLITAAKLALMLVGTTVLAWVIWLAGTVLGAHSSRRVLFRRLSVVFTVLLVGYVLSHFAPTHPHLEMVAMALYLWSAALGYFALREQFGLNHLETGVLALFATLAVSFSWTYSNDLLEKTAQKQLVELARTAPAAVAPKRLNR